MAKAKKDCFPRFFDLEGTPLRQDAANKLPSVYAGRGTWKTYYDSARVAQAAHRIDESAFNRLVAELDDAPAPAAAAVAAR